MRVRFICACETGNLSVLTLARGLDLAAMFELIAEIMGNVAMGRMAENNGDVALKWGAITFGACLIAFFLIPLPFLRILLALGAVFIAMTVTKKTYY